MIKIFGILLLYISLLQGAVNLKIASYNVENLFDLQISGQEYEEYIPNTQSRWNQKNYKAKIKNISQVIKDINADIIALQEIESLQALKDLRFTLKNSGLYYQYFKIADKKNTTTKVALLSKIPFISKELVVTPTNNYRNILEAKFIVNQKELYVFVNHWKSKAGPESMRIVSAKKVLARVNEIGKDKNIILLGDFNSHYEENILFVRKRKHNDTDGITGINDILGTKNHKQKSEITKIDDNSFYNLWYDTDKSERFSYIFQGEKEALDNILVSSSLLDTKNISYKTHSISPYKPQYLFKGKSIYRWQTSKKMPHIHKGKGYSDHLPITAEFLVN